MGIDFSDFLGGDEEKILNPRDIFFTLDRGSQFTFPRDIQTEVLNRWFEERDNSDNVIKLNVGSGKTLVGLLILQSSINEGKGPALYITPDIQLAQQVMNEASALGLDVTDNPRDSGYAAGVKICVTNVYKLFNGKSVFGVGTSQISIGTVVIDDAHACVSTITDQFRIKLPNTHSAYNAILTTLSEDLKGYNEARFLEIQDSDPRANMEVPFWSWSAHQPQILKALYDSKNDNLLQFTYPLLNQILPYCRCVIGGQHLEIEPYFPATDIIQSFRRAKRRVYMTATLADDSVIITHFGADAKKVAKPIVPMSSESMGERMILLPQELNSDITLTDVRALLVDLAKRVNVVVIVPSGPAAETWRKDADQVLIGDSVVAGIETLRTQHAGLTILVNRYDGIDLPGNACRVLAIVDLPEVTSYVDMIDSDVLSGTAVQLRRQVERIEQGMGRGVRSNDDYCAVLLLGPKLTARLRSQEGEEMLTPATRAQLRLSRWISRNLKDPTIPDIKSVLLQCIDRDVAWMKASKKVLVGLRTDDKLRIDESKIALRLAFDSARANQHEKSVAILDNVIDGTNDIQIKAWLLSKKAAFQHTIDAAGAQKTLTAAHSLEPSIIKPLHGVSYQKLSPATGQQAATLISNHLGRFFDPTGMKLFADALCSDLQFSQESADKFEAALQDLGWFLGIRSQRPEKSYKEGPDNLWALPNQKFLVIECKNGVTSTGGISKKDAGQLGQSMEWFGARYPASQAVPILIHPERTLGQGASIVTGMRVIDRAGLDKICRNLRALAKQLVNPDVSASPLEVGKRLTHFEFSADAVVNAYSAPLKN